MATSYTAEFKILNTSTFADALKVYFLYYQLSSGSGNYGPNAGSFNSIIDGAFNDSLLSIWGGSYTISSATSGIYDIYTIEYTGLTSDPALDLSTGDLCAFSVQSDDDVLYSARWIPDNICPDTNVVCNDCLTLNITNCTETIELMGFDNSTGYKLVFTDNQSNVNYTYYEGSSNVGIITIDVSNFPDGTFNPYTTFTVDIFDNNDEPFSITVNGVSYDCFRLSFSPNTVVFD